MKKKTGSADQWIQFIGKDKLQTFQDNFARAYGVSMIFLDMDGNPLTVGSQNSLFCFTIQKEHAVRCQENFQMDMDTMQKGESFIHVCPFGIACLYVPVYFNNRLTKQRFHITSYNKETTWNILMLLESMLRLLNVNCTVSQKDAAQKQEDALPVNVRDERISRREQEIVQLLCKGYTNKQIARQLFISETTVKTHISNILAKLNLHDRMQIVVYYYNKINGAEASDTNNNEETD